jgi:hypothetical protein
MSDLPERITATFNNWRNPNVGACYKNDAGDTEYIREDIADAAVKAERERCARVAEQRIGVCDALRQASCWDDNCELIAKTAEVEAGIIAAAIRKGEQP